MWKHKPKFLKHTIQKPKLKWQKWKHNPKKTTKFKNKIKLGDISIITYLILQVQVQFF
jgi:hypothetical protein